MKKLLLVHPFLTVGGAERMMAYLADLLSSKYDVIIVLLDKKDIFFELNDKIKIIELDNYYHKLQSDVGKTEKIKIIKNIVHALRQIAEEEKVEAVISFDDRITWLTWLAFFHRNIKTIYSQRNDPYDKSKIKNLLFRYIYNHSDGVVYQLEEVKKFYNTKKRVDVIPNPYFGRVFPYHNKYDHLIISAGRLQDRKRFDLLIKAFSNVYKNHPQYRLIIYGDGEERANLENLVKSLELTGAVSLPGVQKNVLENNRNAEMFVLSSDAEGMPNTLIEAMGNGIPVIATDCTPGGARFLLDNGKNGLLVSRGNVDQLSHAMEEYIKSTELMHKKAESATRFLMATLNEKNINQRWLNFISGVLKE